MTVSSTTRTAGPFIGNGVQTLFTFTMRVFQDTDIVATQTTTAGVPSTLVLASDYTITVNADQRNNPGGVLTMLAPLASQYQLSLTTNIAATQEARLANASGFYAEVVENGLDKLTVLLQQQQVVGAQTLRVPEAAGVSALPAVTARASRLAVFDADGDADVTAFTQGQVAAVLSAASITGVTGGYVLGTELQTATAAQTVFDLATVSYVPGVKSLLVVVDGAEYPPLVDYAETSTTRVTFGTGFAGGEQVLFKVGRFVTSGVEDNQVGTQASGTGTVARSQGDRNEDVFSIMEVLTDTQRSNVRNFTNGGALTAAFATARARVAAAGGGRIWLPPGLYPVADETLLNSAGIEFIGSGRQASRILQTAADKRVFNISAEKCGVSHLGIIYNTQGTSGGTGIYSTAFYGNFEDLYLRYVHRGIHFGAGSNSQEMRGIHVEDYTSVGMYCADGAANVLLTHAKFLCANTTLGALGAIRFENQVEGCTITDVQTYQGAYPFTSEAATYAMGSRPAYNKFVNVFFDSGAAGAVINEMVDTDFVGCWFSNRPGSGATLTTCDGMRFIGGGAVNCAQYGMVIEATALHTRFIGFDARGNSASAANTYDGLIFAAGTTDFSVLGGRFGGTLGFGTQRYGISVAVGASDRYIIAGCNVTGNGTGGISDGGTGTEKTIHPNSGARTVNSGASTVVIGAAARVITHGLGFTPAIADIAITDNSSRAASSVTAVWVSAVGATTFQVNTQANVAGADYAFAWQARAKGA